VFAKAVVGFSSLLAFDGRPKSSCKTQDEDAQGDGSSDGIDDDEEEENEEEEDKASKKIGWAFSIAKRNTIIGAVTIDLDTGRDQGRSRVVSRRS
jgi:hypothetical protein